MEDWVGTNIIIREFHIQRANILAFRPLGVVNFVTVCIYYDKLLLTPLVTFWEFFIPFFLRIFLGVN